jgi:hypothetical protein
MTSKGERQVDKTPLVPRWAQCQTCKESRLEGQWRVNDDLEPDVPHWAYVLFVYRCRPAEASSRRRRPELYYYNTILYYDAYGALTFDENLFMKTLANIHDYMLLCNFKSTKD